MKRGHTMPFELVGQGAESKLYSGTYLQRPVMVKTRFVKQYRHPELDERLTKDRMRAELRGLLRSKAIGIRTPAIYFVDGKTNSIYMERLENVDTVNKYIGKMLKSCESGDTDDTSSSCKEKLTLLANEIGITVGKMHEAGIIHGDLTTSNILVNNLSQDKPELALIDFGLSHVDNSAEDKGVDLYVLERALTSTHSNIPWFFDIVLEAYKASNGRDGSEVGVKLDEIRLRGRKRDMIG